MSCSRLSWFFTATSIAANRRRIASGCGRAVAVAAVGEPRPRQVDLGEVGVGAPRALLDDRRGCRIRSRPAAARTGGRRRRPRRAIGFIVGGSSSAADQPDRVVEEVDHVREGVAEEAADAQRHVDARRGRARRAGSLRGR